jgi:endoglucanase
MSIPKLISLAFVTAIVAVFVFSCSNPETPDLPPIQSENSSSSDDSSFSAGEWNSSSSYAIVGSSSSAGERNNSSSSTIVGSSSSINERNSSSSSTIISPSANGPVFRYGKLKASGNKLVGSKTGSTAVQVRGVSLGWSNTNWESARFFTAPTVNAMVDHWKAEIIRVPMGYAASSGESEYPGSYLWDKSGNIARVKTAIDAAIAKDVYVIIDWHSHSAHLGLSDAVEFFTEMAKTYGGYNNVIFEIYNEPNCSDGSSNSNCTKTTWAQIKTYANSIIATIRQHSDNLILVGTPNWDQKVSEAVSSPINDANVAYVFHFYADTHPLNSFQSTINATLNAGLPVFVSEYGTTHADGGCNPETPNSNCKDGNQYNSHNATNANAWHAFMDEKKISSCAWSVNDRYEGSAFFGTGTSFDMSSWTNTSKMTASGQYIYNKLRAYSSGILYCDFGVFNSYGGGCYIISSTSECDTEYGTVRPSCPREQYCDFGPVNEHGGGCFEIGDASDCDLEWGTLTNSCGSDGFKGTKQ